MSDEPEAMSNMHEMEQFYKIVVDDALRGLLDVADGLRDEINRNRPLEGDLWAVVEEKLLVEWTYNSNAIEGSTLTQGETLFFLKHGLTVEGKPFKDFLDAKNHVEAIQFLYDVVKQQRAFTPGLIKEFNALLLSGVSKTPAIDRYGNRTEKEATPGEYKKYSNHVLQPDGSIHKYVDPVHVPAEIEFLTRWVEDKTGSMHPIITASVAHYNLVRIHPFDDGNGRGARLFMNLILIRQGFPPAIIKNEHRRKYIDALSRADSGDVQGFVSFVANACVDTLRSINEILRLKAEG